MKRRCKLGALVCAAAILGTAFTGCNAGGAASGTTGSTASGETTVAAQEISFMTWESQAMNDQILASFKAFEAKNPGVTVKLTPSPLADYGTKIKQMISSQTAPDVFMVGNDWVIQYGSSGNLYDWTEKAAADGIEKEYYPGVVENWKVDGKLYGFPGLLNTYGVFYNKKTFDDAGLAYPKDGWSYEEMIEMAKALTKEDGGNHTYGLYTNGKFDPFFVSTYASAAGDKPFAEKMMGNTQVQASPKFKEAITLVADAVKAKYITDNEFNVSNAATMFMEGKMPMMTAGQWFADEFIRNAPKDLQWGFVSWPIAKDGKPTAIYDCTGWASSKDIKNPDLIYDMIKYIHTDMYKEVLPQTPVAPSAATAYAQPYYDKLVESGHQEMVDAMKYMLECENKLPIRFLDTYASDAGAFITDAWGPIINGQKPVDDVDKIVESINGVLAK